MRPFVSLGSTWQVIAARNRVGKVDRTRKHARLRPERRRASSFLRMITFAKAMYELIGLLTSLLFYVDQKSALHIQTNRYVLHKL